MLHRTLVPAILLCSVLGAQSADWAQYRGPSGDGHSPDKVVLPVGSAAPKQVWKAPSDGGFSSFAVSNGRAFTLSLKDIEGAKQEILNALRQESQKD